MIHAQSILSLAMVLALLWVQPGLTSEEKSQDAATDSQSSTSTSEPIPVQYYPPPDYFQAPSYNN